MNSHNSVIHWLMPVIAVVIIAIGWLIAYNYAQNLEQRDREAFETARQSQVESCERVNILRMEVNGQIEVLQEFLNEAAQARQNAADAGTGEQADIDQATADRYVELAQRANPIEIPDCEEIIPDYPSLVMFSETASG